MRVLSCKMADEICAAGRRAFRTWTRTKGPRSFKDMSDAEFGQGSVPGDTLLVDHQQKLMAAQKRRLQQEGIR